MPKIYGELVLDMKWPYYCVDRLNRLPPRFREGIEAVLSLHALTAEDIGRRREAFMVMWRQMVPRVERELETPYEVFKEMV